MSAKPRMARKMIAEGAASVVLGEMKIEGLRVDPIEIATRKGIAVEAKPSTVQGVSGMLVKAGDNFGILYATHVSSKGFQKFCVAHELGHYCIEGHANALLAHGPHYSHAHFTSNDPFEMEADYFAAALLMPEVPFRKEANRNDPGLTAIETLARDCETSLTATAIRYAGLTRDAVAVILSTGPSIDWCFMSEGLKEAKKLEWIRKGTPVPSGTATESFNAQAENVRLGKKDSGDGRLNDWMGGERVYRITEEVVGLGQYGRTLTVLTCEILTAQANGDESDEDGEAELVESWTPKFRR
ncbi:ImmA/IrrE family metallo-endopeptidase [Bradyrhizobium barranii]|uniref:ImmA/IrrE family metallo-endopeptidase n=1 Tax=Bradyrhizobium barranii TaxID=2992140 RepID=A0ABY3QQU4_9BRAD|nr:ImmA/IrrE family metallo-endopeptidase [Bradyrhizobium japonicum]UFW88237.1 ImmA/IrrE family metallo-endopeptidase [Bradyrhizobium japonicum]